MLRIFVLISLLFSFSFYALAHGTCSSFESDIAKCVLFTEATQDCESHADAEEDQSEDYSAHECGCIGAFEFTTEHSIHLSASKDLFEKHMTQRLLADFIQSIDRPPIS